LGGLGVAEWARWRAVRPVSQGTHILLPTNGSLAARHAEAHVRALPWPGPVHVTVMMAINVPRPPFTSVIPLARQLYSAALAGLRQDAKAWEVVTEARRALGSQVGSVATRVQEGQPGPVIVGIARACRADLVVMGSGRSRAWTRFVPGRVSVHVVRHAHCSVLVAKSLPAEPQRFLLALDGSADAGTAIRWLEDLRLSAEAWIHVVAVVGGRRGSWVYRGLGPRGHNKGARVGRLAAECAAAEGLVTEASHRLAASGARLTASIRRGQTAGEILAAARAFAPHLLVVGAREERATPDTVLSSLAGRVIGRAPCSVLVVRS
jgi:nucleotide-binding universal stress UspA family protein